MPWTFPFVTTLTRAVESGSPLLTVNWRPKLSGVLHAVLVHVSSFCRTILRSDPVPLLFQPFCRIYTYACCISSLRLVVESTKLAKFGSQRCVKHQSEVAYRFLFENKSAPLRE